MLIFGSGPGRIDGTLHFGGRRAQCGSLPLVLLCLCVSFLWQAGACGRDSLY